MTIESKIIKLTLNDCKIMALRLMGESDDTFSPECYEVMARWRPVCEALLREEVLHG